MAMTSALPCLRPFRPQLRHTSRRWLGALVLMLLGLSGAMAQTSVDPVVNVTFSGAVQDIAGKGATVTVYDAAAKAHPSSGATNVDYGPTNSTSTFGSAGGKPFWNWTSASSYGGGLTIDVPLSVSSSRTYSMGLRFRICPDQRLQGDRFSGSSSRQRLLYP